MPPPLTLRRLDKQFPDDYAVVRDGRAIGRIYRYRHGPAAGTWFWAVAVLERISGRASSGVEETLEDAKAKFKAAVE